MVEQDIYRSAKVYIEQYGEEAILKAMHRIEECRCKSDENGMIVWNKIAEAIMWLQMPTDLVDTTCH